MTTGPRPNTPWRFALAAAFVVVPTSLASTRPNDPPRELAIALGPDAPPFIAEESMAWPHRIVTTSPWIPLGIFVWLASALILAAVLWRFVPVLRNLGGSTALPALASLILCALAASLLATPPDVTSTLLAFPPLLAVASAAYGVASIAVRLKTDSGNEDAQS